MYYDLITTGGEFMEELAKALAEKTGKPVNEIKDYLIRNVAPLVTLVLLLGVG